MSYRLMHVDDAIAFRSYCKSPSVVLSWISVLSNIPADESRDFEAAKRGSKNTAVQYRDLMPSFTLSAIPAVRMTDE